jgi:hypothetical protein
MDFFPEIDLSRDAVEAMARGLFAVANCDGLHEREMSLIASFWIDTGGSETALAELSRGQAPTPVELAAHLHTAVERHLFVKTALLLAWADGKVTADERRVVGDFAEALGVDPPALERLEASVKDFLLGHLTHLHNTEASRDVAKKLGV